MTEREPICTHTSEAIGWVASHDGQPPPGEPHANTEVCARNECIADAAEWVAEVTGFPAHFYPFRVRSIRP